MKGEEWRKFWRAARQRMTEAEELFNARHDYKYKYNLVSMYLAGYAVECALKALLLKVTPLGQHKKLAKEYFCGSKGHDFGELKALLQRQGQRMPAQVTTEFFRFSAWSTDMRYEVGYKDRRETTQFLEAAKNVLAWVKRCL